MIRQRRTLDLEPQPAHRPAYKHPRWLTHQIGCHPPFSDAMHLLALLIVWAIAQALEIHDLSLEQTLLRARYSFVYFFRDGCQYCEEFRPTYSVIEQLYDEVQIICVNGHKNKRTAELFGITQYPSLRALDFETKRITSYDRRDRLLESVMAFIEEYTPGKADFSRISTNVTQVTDTSQLENLPQDTLVVYLWNTVDWDTWYYPTHFFHLLASYNVSLAVVDVNNLENLDVVAKYHVSNFPSAVLLRADGTIVTHKTLHSWDKLLTEYELRNMLDGDYSKYTNEYGDLEEMHRMLAASLVVYDKQKRRGMNVVQGDEDDADLEHDYSSLLEEIVL